MRRFNTTGTCFQEDHYMVDISGKLAQIEEMVNRGEYFTINRARQYGKTTTLWQLEQDLKDKYNVISISFEGVGNTFFSSEKDFVKGFVNVIKSAMIYSGLEKELQSIWQTDMDKINNFNILSEHITLFCKQSSKPVVLIVDEVDKSSDNQLFLDFLGMLRNKYLIRKKAATFYCVILAGVYDIKNLKLKVRSDSEKKYNSPWNVAADFLVDMSFNPKEIQTMLNSYETDHKTGMDIYSVSNQIYLYTEGYPFLVSKICEKIDTEEKYSWDEAGIRLCVKDLLCQTNTLFDDIIKNLENDKEYSDLVEAVVFGSSPVPFRISNPLIARGVMFGVFKEKGGNVTISNKIFEMYIYEYFISVNQPLKGKVEYFEYLQNGELNMPAILMAFQSTMKKMQGNVTAFENFIESHGRLLIIAFLTPILNGTGHYVIESWGSDKTRMDIQIFYGAKEYILELKIWHGEKKEQEAYHQLSKYLETRSLNSGYLINFVFNKKKNYKAEWIMYEEKDIFEINV